MQECKAITAARETLFKLHPKGSKALVSGLLWCTFHMGWENISQLILWFCPSNPFSSLKLVIFKISQGLEHLAAARLPPRNVFSKMNKPRSLSLPSQAKCSSSNHL